MSNFFYVDLLLGLAIGTFLCFFYLTLKRLDQRFDYLISLLRHHESLRLHENHYRERLAAQARRARRPSPARPPKGQPKIYH